MKKEELEYTRNCLRQAMDSLDDAYEYLDKARDNEGGYDQVRQEIINAISRLQSSARQMYPVFPHTDIEKSVDKISKYGDEFDELAKYFEDETEWKLSKQ